MNRMTELIRHTMVRCALIAGLAVSTVTPAIVHAQINPEIANCEELKDEATLTQVNACVGHPGCALVIAIHKTCVRAKRFLNNLREAIGEGTRGFFGPRREITPDAIFEASLTDRTRALNTLPETQDMAASIRSSVREVRNETISVPLTDGRAAVYYGEVKDGKGEGFGTYIAPSGYMQRGKFIGNRLNGVGEEVFPDGSRAVGNFVNDRLSGQGAYAGENGSLNVGRYEDGLLAEGRARRADGSRMEGRFEPGKNASGQRTNFIAEGKQYRADGTLREEGRYESGRFSVGKLYDPTGTTVVSEVNLPRERELAAAAAEQRKREAVEQRLASEAAALQQKREEAERSAQAFRDSLNTMNPGQLFARADELSSQGDQARSREVLRSLVSRFPDHQLAANAAQQLANSPTRAPATMARASSPQSGSSGAGTGGGGAPASGATACRVAYDQLNQTIKAGNARMPRGATATATMQFGLWATSESMKLGQGACRGQPQEAELTSMRKQYDALVQSCRAIATHDGVCVPRIPW